MISRFHERHAIDVVVLRSRELQLLPIFRQPFAICWLGCSDGFRTLFGCFNNHHELVVHGYGDLTWWYSSAGEVPHLITVIIHIITFIISGGPGVHHEQYFVGVHIVDRALPVGAVSASFVPML